VPPEVRTEYVEETKEAGGEVSTEGLMRRAEDAAVQRRTANMAAPETYRYRLALARTAEQASHIAQFDAEEAAQIVDENSAIVLESAASTWTSWVARLRQAVHQPLAPGCTGAPPCCPTFSWLRHPAVVLPWDQGPTGHNRSKWRETAMGAVEPVRVE